MTDINETIERIARLAFDNAVDPEDGSTCTSAVNKYQHGVVLEALRYTAREARNAAFEEAALIVSDMDPHIDQYESGGWNIDTINEIIAAIRAKVTP